MLKYYSTEPSQYSYEEQGSYYYKIFLRENISATDSQYSCNEYSINVLKQDDIESYLTDNFSILLENAKLNEQNRILSEKINTLEKQLTNSDYQIIKCTENYMLGSVLPYDFSKLLYDRQKIRDEINNLQDTESLTQDLLSEEKERKIKEMSAASQTTITNGIDFNEKHYRLNTTDQINLTSLYALALNGNSVPYHADGEVCSIYTAEEMVNLATTATQFIIYHTTYFNLLKHQILSMESIDEVQAVSYGMTLNDEYQTVLNSITSQNS